MPKILIGGKLVTVPHLKSDKMKKTITEPVTKPEEVIAPDSNLDDVDSSNNDLTVAELKALLDSHEIEYPSSAKKADLVDLADSIGSNEADEV